MNRYIYNLNDFDHALSMIKIIYTTKKDLSNVKLTYIIHNLCKFDIRKLLILNVIWINIAKAWARKTEYRPAIKIFKTIYPRRKKLLISESSYKRHNAVRCPWSHKQEAHGESCFGYSNFSWLCARVLVSSKWLHVHLLGLFSKNHIRFV